MDGTFKAGSKRMERNDLWKFSMSAAAAVGEMLKTSIGPLGSYKVLVDYLENIKVTSRGLELFKFLLEDYSPKHDKNYKPVRINPIIKIIAEGGLSIHKNLKDGVITYAVLSGALMEKAAKLIHEKLHINTIVKGYKLALSWALEELAEIAVKINPGDKETLTGIARTILAKSYLGPSSAQKLAECIVDAYTTVVKNTTSDIKKFEPEKAIQIIVKAGGYTLDSKFIQGLVLERGLKHSLLPKKIVDAKIALIEDHMDIKRVKWWHEIKISNAADINNFKKEEEMILEKMFESVRNLGVNVVFCKKGINDKLLYLFGRAGIMAVRDINAADFEMLSAATSSKIVPTPDKLQVSDLGYAAVVEERIIGAENWVFVEGCRKPKAVSLMIRGGAYMFADELKHVVKSAINALHQSLVEERVLPGAGAVELELSKRLRKRALTVSGKLQPAIQAYAEALESIPKALLESAGVDVLEKLATLKALHENGETGACFDVLSRKVTDAFRETLLEPYSRHEVILKSATELVSQLMRIDNAFLAGRRSWGELPKVSEQSTEFSRRAIIGEPGSYPTYGEPY
jgi:chaperonin GroEL (HSP60 family)